MYSIIFVTPGFEILEYQLVNSVFVWVHSGFYIDVCLLWSRCLYEPWFYSGKYGMTVLLGYLY